MMNVPIGERGTRGTRRLARSAQRIAASMDRMARSQRCLLPVFRGGALADGDSADGYVRDRVRRFFDGAPMPKVFAGPSAGDAACDVCGRRLLRGASEYELAFSALRVRLDRHCFAMWQSEIAQN